MNEKGKKEVIYDLKPIKAPVASGASLKMLCALVENGATGALLAGNLLAQTGVKAMRAAQADALHPLTPPLPRVEEPDLSAGPLDAERLQALPASKAAESSFRFETAADLVRAFKEGKSTPEKVAEKILAACRADDEREPPMRAFISQDEEDVMRQAKDATRRYAGGIPLGPLDGVPVAIKDELDQKGYGTTVGTRFLGKTIASEDAWAVASLRRAGAVLIGKANMHEIGLGVTGVNPHHGPARNPYDPTRATGGSSSGPAACVAAGLGPVAVGADGGGSIRIPAALCGLVGLKPTFGRVSERGAAPLCWSVAHVGPIGATARDVALAYGLMAGIDPEDGNTHLQPSVSLDEMRRPDLKKIKLGIYRPWFEDASEDIVAACQKMLSHFEGLGAELVEVELPELSLLRVVHMVTIVSEMAASMSEHMKAHRKDFGHDTRMNLALAARLSASDYIHAQRLRMRISAHFSRAMDEVDMLLTPATACTAPVISAKVARTGESNLGLLEQLMRFAPAANLTGLPAISFPAGYNAEGMPIGMQAMGRPFEEDLLLGLAGFSEGFVARKAPKVHHRLLD